MSAFSTEFGVCDEVENALQTLEWMLPTDVQSEACPLILGGGDVLMAAETGSGKTGAFCIPVVQIVLETLREKRDGVKPSTSRPAGGAKMAMNIWDRSPQFAISPDGLLCQSREQKVWQGSRATYGVANQGKWYYEATITDEGLCRVGFSTSRAALGDLGCDNQGFGFGGTGKKSFCRQFDDYGEPFGLSDTIGCFLDLDSASIKYSKNGKVFSKAFGIPADMLHNTTIFPACTLKNAEIKFNFGDEPFKHPPGNGFSGFAGADPKHLIKSLAAPEKSASSQSRKRQNCPQALILEPSKELAEQTHNCINTLKQYCKDPAIRTLCCVGGANIRDQIEALESGVDIVTGTPGRLGDLISNEKLGVRDVRFFILDEADGLLQQQHGDLIQTIWKKIPQVTADNKRLQVVVCSATLHSREVKQLADKIMHFPVWVDLKGQDSVPDTVHNVVCMVDPTKDLSWQSSSAMITTDGVHRVEGVRAGTHSPEGLSEAVKILKGIYVVNAIKKHQMDQAIIFCRTRLDCDNMERFLWSQGGGRNRNNPFACACLHGDKRNDRAINLEKFKKKEIKFLICTDVAARGLDVSGLPFMISVTMPPSEEKQTYVHRIGRVGRAERMGLAIALVSRFKEKVWYHQCPSRGKNCSNINLTDHGGCCKWYDENTYLGYSGEALTANLDVTEVKRGSKGNPFVTLIIQFSGASRVVTTSEILLIWSGLSPSEASIQVAPVQVIIVLEEVNASLIVQRNSLDNDLWILIPIILGTFLLACLITIICYLIQPKTDNHITRTSSTIFKQGSQPAWVHSGSKVEKLREPWWTSRAAEQVEADDEIDQKRPNYVDATTETGPAMEENCIEKEVEDLELSEIIEPPVELEQVKTTEEDENQHADVSMDSSESGVEMIQTQPVVSPYPDTVGNELSSTAPPRINSNELMSLYDLWYFYRAFDQTRNLDEENLEKELTLPKMPSEFSETLEFKHPNLLEDPTRAIVEQTGKVPPSQKPKETPDNLDDTTLSSDLESVENLATMGTKLYPKEGNQLHGTTLKPVNTHRKDSKGLHDEIDIAASVRFAPEAVNFSTFKHMQAELRRIYNEPQVAKDSGSNSKVEEPELEEKDDFNDLESGSSDSF